jgi:ribosomal protein S27E
MSDFYLGIMIGAAVVLLVAMKMWPHQFIPVNRSLIKVLSAYYCPQCQEIFSHTDFPHACPNCTNRMVEPLTRLLYRNKQGGGSAIKDALARKRRSEKVQLIK